MPLSFVVDNRTDTALGLFERDDLADEARRRLGSYGRFIVEPYRPGGDELTVARIKQIGGTLEAYTFG